MSVPNHQAIVERVYAAGSYDLRTREGCGTLVEAACVELHKADARWGHLKKVPPQTNYNGHSHDGCLYLSDTPGQSVHVDFIAGAEGPNPSITWQPDAPRYSRSDWYAPTLPPAPHTCRLGCSLFWGLAGVRHHPDKLRRNLLWIRDVLGADYVRVLAVVGGDLFSGADPWQHAGAFYRWSDWSSLVGHLTDLCFDSYGLTVEWTVFGSRGQTPTLGDCERVVDDLGAVLAPRAAKVELVEVWNEYNINGASTADLRHLSRRLRAGLPASIPIALSSPGTVHGCASVSEIHAEVRQMYDGLPEATAITPHWCRAHHVPPDLGPFAPSILVNNEPRGPGASAGGDVDDPALIASDYRGAIAKGYRGNTYHPLGGIWGGMCHAQWSDQNRWPDVWSSPGANATAAQLKAIRQGGSVEPPAPPHPPIGSQPYPSEQDWWPAYEADVAALYAQAGQVVDPVVFAAGRWFSRPGYSIGSGMDKDAAKARHLAELRAALGLP